MRLPLYRVITAHSIRLKSRMCCFFYSLFKILLTYCMYIIVNKATFMVIDTIMTITRNNIKLINTTSLSDSNTILVKWQHISTISFPMAYNISHFLLFVYMTEMVFCRIFLENTVGGAVLGAPFL